MLILWVLYMPVSWFLVRGFEDPNTIPFLELPEVDPESWGGLLLTMVLTFIPIAFSLPIGILLALGRQSQLPIISTASTLSIELVRGVPLITLLFMASLLVGFFDTSLRDVNDVIKMMVALTIFSAAYLAEVVRGGLQIISKGQVEAAQALGLNPVLTTLFITLPQALRAVIPAIMSQFVSLFKDTSLVVIIGLFELVGVARRLVPAQEGGIFSAASRETYLFVGIIYFVISYAMSAVSRELEETGAGAARQ
jgi:general L-amino acid transport system permease protein